MDDRNDVAENFPLQYPYIIVRKSSLASNSDKYQLALDVVDFINQAAHEALFYRGEVPPDAFRAYHVDYYIAQVQNGGHGQFAHNSRWSKVIIDNINQGLTEIGHQKALEIFRNFVSFSYDEPARFQSVIDGSGFGTIDPFIQNLDDEFFEFVSDSLCFALREWIKKMPNLRPLSEEDFQYELRNLAKNNPNYLERRSALVAAEQLALANDPLHQALHFMCQGGSPPVRFEKIIGSFPVSKDDFQAVVYHITTDCGNASVWFSNNTVLLAMDDEPGARNIVRQKQVDEFLAARGLVLPIAAYQNKE